MLVHGDDHGASCLSRLISSPAPGLRDGSCCHHRVITGRASPFKGVADAWSGKIAAYDFSTAHRSAEVLRDEQVTIDIDQRKRDEEAATNGDDPN